MAKKTPSPVEMLRAELKARKLSGFIVPRQDEFQGEYVAAYAERLHWLTGFAGSWGTAIVTATKAAIFVDGRYTVQVAQQVNPRVFVPHHLMEDPPARWIERTLKKGDRLGFDPWLSTAADADRYAEACARAGARLVPVTGNPVDAVWKDQPARPKGAVTSHPTQFAGRSAADKKKDMAKALAGLAADAAVLTQPDSVSWVFNIRGSDVPYTPVVLAYAILHRGVRPEIFVDEARLAEEARAALKRVAVIRKPAAIEASLLALARRKARVVVDAASAPARIRDLLKAKGARIVEARDPCVLPKARKNSVEREGARAAHIRDGAAIVHFLRWLEKEAPRGNITERAAAAKLHEFRKATGALRDLSFDTIAAAGPNAAIPHYRVSEASSRTLAVNEIFLVDSGAQYEDGTTDITRTVIVGEPTAEMRDRFTRVLKGMIAVSRLRFPAGTCGSQIDTLARRNLWAAGLDYDHGTGHGVGSYLSVHEGPARINKSDRTPLEPGMILSNEPGYYKPGHFGIRIENLLMVEEATAVAGGERPMLGFETLTHCPIDRRLIEPRLLDRDEVAWIDAYHARVLATLDGLVEGFDLAWLRLACAPLAKP